MIIRDYCQGVWIPHLTWQSSECAPCSRSTPSQSQPPLLNGPASRTWTCHGHQLWCPLRGLHSARSLWHGRHLRPKPRWPSAWPLATGSSQQWLAYSACLYTSAEKRWDACQHWAHSNSSWDIHQVLLGQKILNGALQKQLRHCSLQPHIWPFFLPPNASKCAYDWSLTRQPVIMRQQAYNSHLCVFLPTFMA